MLSSTPVRVLFNESLNEQGHIDLNYKKLRQVLNANNFKVDRSSSRPITSKILQRCDIFVIPCPTNAKLDSHEIAAILKFLEEGNGLLVLSGNGGDKELYTNLNQLSVYFGVVFNDNQVIDESRHVVFNTVLRVTNIQPHEVVEGINEIHYPSGCSLRVKDYPAVLAYSSEGADPPNKPLIVTSHYKNKGKVVLSGSYRIFRDKVLGGIDSAQNLNFALNLFNYLAKKTIQPAWQVGLESKFSTATQPGKNLGSPTPTRISPETASIGKKVPMGSKPVNMISAKTEETKDSLTFEILQDSIISLQRDLKELRSFVQNGFYSMRQTIEQLEAKHAGKVKKVTPVIQKTEVPITTGNVDEALGEAKAEHKSLLELLDYITQRYQVGALDQADFSHQRNRLTKEIQTVEDRIKLLESRK